MGEFWCYFLVYIVGFLTCWYIVSIFSLVIFFLVFYVDLVLGFGVHSFAFGWAILVGCVMSSCGFIIVTRFRCKMWVRIVVITGVITLIISGCIIVRIIRIIVINILFVIWGPVVIIILFFNCITITVSIYYSLRIILVKGMNAANNVIWNGQRSAAIMNDCPTSIETIKIINSLLIS